MDDEWVARAVLCVTMLGAGALMIWMAHAAAAGRLRRNPWAGIRIASTMTSDAAWLAAHARAKRPTVLGGVVAAASGVLALLPVPMPVVVVGVLVGAVLMLALAGYGAAAGSRAARAADDRP